MPAPRGQVRIEADAHRVPDATASSRWVAHHRWVLLRGGEYRRLRAGGRRRDEGDERRGRRSGGGSAHLSAHPLHSLPHAHLALRILLPDLLLLQEVVSLRSRRLTKA